MMGQHCGARGSRREAPTSARLAKGRGRAAYVQLANTPWRLMVGSLAQIAGTSAASLAVGGHARLQRPTAQYQKAAISVSGRCD